MAVDPLGDGIEFGELMDYMDQEDGHLFGLDESTSADELQEVLNDDGTPLWDNDNNQQLDEITMNWLHDQEEFAEINEQNEQSPMEEGAMTSASAKTTTFSESDSPADTSTPDSTAFSDSSSRRTSSVESGDSREEERMKSPIRSNGSLENMKNSTLWKLITKDENISPPKNKKDDIEVIDLTDNADAVPAHQPPTVQRVQPLEMAHPLTAAAQMPPPPLFPMRRDVISLIYDKAGSLPLSSDPIRNQELNRYMQIGNFNVQLSPAVLRQQRVEIVKKRKKKGERRGMHEDRYYIPRGAQGEEARAQPIFRRIGEMEQQQPVEQQQQQRQYLQSQQRVVPPMTQAVGHPETFEDANKIMAQLRLEMPGMIPRQTRMQPEPSEPQLHPMQLQMIEEQRQQQEQQLRMQQQQQAAMQQQPQRTPQYPQQQFAVQQPLQQQMPYQPQQQQPPNPMTSPPVVTQQRQDEQWQQQRVQQQQWQTTQPYPPNGQPQMFQQPYPMAHNGSGIYPVSNQQGQSLYQQSYAPLPVDQQFQPQLSMASTLSPQGTSQVFSVGTASTPLDPATPTMVHPLPQEAFGYRDMQPVAATAAAAQLQSQRIVVSSTDNSPEPWPEQMEQSMNGQGMSDTVALEALRATVSDPGRRNLPNYGEYGHYLPVRQQAASQRYVDTQMATSGAALDPEVQKNAQRIYGSAPLSNLQVQPSESSTQRKRPCSVDEEEPASSRTFEVGESAEEMKRRRSSTLDDVSTIRDFFDDEEEDLEADVIVVKDNEMDAESRRSSIEDFDMFAYLGIEEELL